MQNWFSKTTVLLGLLTLGFTACRKDEVQVTTAFGNAPVLMTSTTSLVLTQANADAPALTYSWNPYTVTLADGAKSVSPVIYTLQLAKAGTNFATPQELSAGTGAASMLTIKTKDLNTLVQALKLTNGVAAPVEARLKTFVTGNLATLYSPTSTLLVTPYEVKAPAVCVQPAASQAWSLIGAAAKGWGTDVAMRYDCASGTFTYTGPLVADEFKFRYGGDDAATGKWKANLGGTSSTGGELTQDGSNLKIATAGTYTIVLTPGAIGADGKATGGTFTIK